MNTIKILTVGFVFWGLGLGSIQAVDEEIVDFGRDVRPILADTCYKCHGPDEQHREGGLRLDIADGGFEDVIEPGELESSDLYDRVMSDDEDLLMPPADSGRVLTAEQKSILKRWIEQGAKWEQHWSLVTPVRPALPDVADAGWKKSPIDRFVWARLKSHGLSPNGESERHALIRRVTLDLTGLPPTPELVSEFSVMKSDDWYEQLVDRLLGSESYGEHMARFWLDAARYGDTHGMHLDNYREMWLYRDWVINAFNENKSYRDFVLEQLAGDLLENPTVDQRVATGFNRAHVSTNEGGSIKEEVYVRNVVDRVATTGTVFLGLTVGCAQCHDHKFDPISQREFYQLFAFFNSLDGNPMDGNVKDHAPALRKIDDEGKARIAKFETELAAAELDFKNELAAIEYVEPELVSDAPPAPAVFEEYVWVDDGLPSGAKQEGPWKFVSVKQCAPMSGEKVRVAETSSFVQHFFTQATKPLRVQKGDVFFAYVFIDPENAPTELMLQFNDGVWEHRAYWGENSINWGADGTKSRRRMGDLPSAGEWVRLEVPAEAVGFEDLSHVNGIAFSQQGGKVFWDAAGVVSKLAQELSQESFAGWLSDQEKAKGKGLPNPIKAIVSQKPDDRKEDQNQKLLDYFLSNIHPEFSPGLKTLSARRDELKKKVNSTRQSFPTTLVWKELAEPKEAFVLMRGEYDKKGDPVSRATPDALPPFGKDLPLNRLGLAKWLLDPAHPLTSRVAVNRFWQQFFGTGIVETSEDFGAQGSLPSHPELLDWLAVEFVESDWDIRGLVKTIVMSNTYRQSSKADSMKTRVDSKNRLFSRGPRLRLDAEMLRDQALAVSELLVTKVGGPSVKPPQPDGLWFAVGYSGSNTVRFKKDAGAEKVHRRSLYTFWKRTAPPPQMSTFDAPSRESCSVRRERTNTPLQALLLMNEPQFIEAARQLASIAMDQPLATSSDSATSRVRFMFERALCRPPTEAEVAVLLSTYQKNLDDYRADPESAKQIVSIGETKPDEKYDVPELASWTMIANLIMNMDEFISKN